MSRREELLQKRDDLDRELRDLDKELAELDRQAEVADLPLREGDWFASPAGAWVVVDVEKRSDVVYEITINVQGVPVPQGREWTRV